MGRLEGKIAAVTGVSSGFGRSCADVFAAEGACVVGMARRRDRGSTLERDVRKRGDKLTFATGDVRRPDDCRRLIETAMSAYGGIDILVNNAGSAGPNPVRPSHEITEEDWDEVLGTNLKGTFFCSRFAIPRMLERGGGVILNIASINAVQAISRMAAYNASKAGVLHLTHSLAVEYGDAGIRVNSIILGGGKTEMATFVADEMARAMKGPDFKRQEKPSQMGLDEFAQLLVLLCTEEARVVTGATIAVDRGVSAGLLTSKMIWGKQAGLVDL